MKRQLIFLLAIFLAACNNSSESSDNNHDSSGKGETPYSTSAHMDYSGCYRQVIGRDTIFLQLDQEGDRFAGKMEFDNFEKDASHGTVKGHMEDGNIVLWYDFTSEGMQSVMDVVLKPVSSGMIRALGEISTRGDTTLLRHDQLNFDASNTLFKFDCSEWD